MHRGIGLSMLLWLRLKIYSIQVLLKLLSVLMLSLRR